MKNTKILLIMILIIGFSIIKLNAATINYGDVNKDNLINSTDCSLIMRYILGTITDFSTTDGKILADVNFDGKINSTDFSFVERYILGTISSFPVNSSIKTSSTVTSSYTNPPSPSFKEVSVHDPSIIKTNGMYYIIGSHLASAKSKDLMSWTSISSSVSNSNVLIPNVYTELKSSFDWSQSTTMWAGDIIQLKDGKYYMYYCMCKGDSPLSALGVAVSDYIEGPYKDKGIIFKSGSGVGADGNTYDATKNPNAVDPDVFYDNNGVLWMVYGSYSGGIYITKIDPSTAKPYSGQGWGKKLLGGNHARIEAPYMLYNKDTGYYYLFLSFGGLTADGGYNLRVSRSQNPDGPFVDANGKYMSDCKGATGTLFDDKSIEPFGDKLIGNFLFKSSGIGYVSPGHNSAYYDEDSKKYFAFFHTRFPGKGEVFEDRVHQILFNGDGWPLIMPHRYSGESVSTITNDEMIGSFQLINHGYDITANIKNSSKIYLNSNGTISGDYTGKWIIGGNNNISITVNNTTYNGGILKQWDTGLKKYVISFAGQNGNVNIWGSKE